MRVRYSLPVEEKSCIALDAETVPLSIEGIRVSLISNQEGNLFTVELEISGVELLINEIGIIIPSTPERR